MGKLIIRRTIKKLPMRNKFYKIPSRDYFLNYKCDVRFKVEGKYITMRRSSMEILFKGRWIRLEEFRKKLAHWVGDIIG